jgi:hypothetical protein
VGIFRLLDESTRIHGSSFHDTQNRVSFVIHIVRVPYHVGHSDQTIMDIAGHVSRQMLKHYSHIRMKAKREALEAVWKKQPESPAGKDPEQTNAAQDSSPRRRDAQKVEGEPLQKSLQSGVSKGAMHRKVVRKPLKRIGSPRGTLFITGNGESAVLDRKNGLSLWFQLSMIYYQAQHTPRNTGVFTHAEDKWDLTFNRRRRILLAAGDLVRFV